MKCCFLEKNSARNQIELLPKRGGTMMACAFTDICMLLVSLGSVFIENATVESQHHAGEILYTVQESETVAAEKVVNI